MIYLVDLMRNGDISRQANVIAYYTNEHVAPLPYLIIKDLNKARLLHALSGSMPTSPSLYVKQSHRLSQTLKHGQKF